MRIAANDGGLTGPGMLNLYPPKEHAATIYVLEPGATGGPGAMGAILLAEALRAAGHAVTRLRLSKQGGGQIAMFTADSMWCDATRGMARPDAYFISCIYPRQWLHLRDLFARIGVEARTDRRSPSDPLVAFGGQVSFAPEPIADYADVIALGDGEATGTSLARAAVRGRAYAMAWALGRRGYYVPSREAPPRPLVRLETGAPARAVAIRPGPVDEARGAISIELARGCQSKCRFCPIGWAGGTYRETPREDVERVIAANPGVTVNLYAPDYSSVSWSVDADDMMSRYGCKHGGRDARLDAADRALQAGGAVREYSFGVEGLSERLRRAVGKPLSDDRIVDVVARLDSVKTIKLYFIHALPGETDADLDALLALLARLRAVRRGRLELTMTHFQSVPHTPLEREANAWSESATARAMALRASLRDEYARSGLQWMASQPKGRELHEHDTWLQRGDRRWARYLDTATDHAVSTGRWRDAAGRCGLSIDDVLAEIGEDAVTPWAHVDVGAERSRVIAARRSYWRALEGA